MMPLSLYYFMLWLWLLVFEKITPRSDSKAHTIALMMSDKQNYTSKPKTRLKRFYGQSTQKVRNEVRNHLGYFSESIKKAEAEFFQSIKKGAIWQADGIPSGRLLRLYKPIFAVFYVHAKLIRRGNVLMFNTITCFA